MLNAFQFSFHQFDGQFPLWQLMWGKYYLEYLVIDLIPSFQETPLVP